MNLSSNDFFEANVQLFVSRFPALAELTGLKNVETVRCIIKKIDPSFSIFESKRGDPTLSYQNKSIHSKYNPKEEARKIVSNASMFTQEGLVFLGLGLGYFPEAYTELYPKAPVVIVEPSISLLALALASRSLKNLFEIEHIILICDTKAADTPLLLEESGYFLLPIFELPGFNLIQKNWNDSFNTAKQKIVDKKNINKNTLQKFGTLWLKNSIKNIFELSKRDGITHFYNSAKEETALILAAGPSLTFITPHLLELKKKCILIAVDTAVRACINQNIEPDFIILTDPQYINWKHIAGLACPSSILVTELATWPSVFQFSCKKIVLSASRFPIARYFESKGKPTGLLGAGGSVSTTAWDFAYYLGCTTIYIAGLDLAFPHRLTHYKGNLFSEITHNCSTRWRNAETASFNALYNASPYLVKNYNDKTVLTDKRLALYSWWFVTRLEQEPQVKTKTLSHEGMHIQGIERGALEEILQQEDRRVIIDGILRNADLNSGVLVSEDNLAKAQQELIQSLTDLHRLAQKASQLCDLAIENVSQNQKKANETLDVIEKLIQHHWVKEIIAPFLEDTIDLISKDAQSSPIQKSSTLYKTIETVCKTHINLLTKKY